MLLQSIDFKKDNINYKLLKLSKKYIKINMAYNLCAYGNLNNHNMKANLNWCRYYFRYSNFKVQLYILFDTSFNFFKKKAQVNLRFKLKNK